MIPLNKTANFVICANVHTNKCTATPASKLQSEWQTLTQPKAHDVS